MACRDEKDKNKIRCPYCDAEVMAASFPFCQACKVTLSYCPECHKPVSRDIRTCPHCGATIKCQSGK